MIQAKATGLVKDRWEMRKIIADSVDIHTYIPNK